MNIQPIELTGLRAKLVPLSEEHIDALYEAGNYPEIWTYMTAPMTSREDMATIVRNALAAQQKGTELPWVVVDQATGKVVGSTRYLNIVPIHRQLEIGWTWYTPAAQRTRINTECKYLLLRHAFEDLKAVRVQIKTDARNERSQNAIRRLGAKFEGILRKSLILPDGYVRDTVYFSIIDSEWPDVKKRLETFLTC
jgi:RimJ/RimL family protein N-acetyltransferase